MSWAFISSAGSGAWPNSRPIEPVRLAPCHWSRSRPVLRANGKRASRTSTGGANGVSTKRARPSSVAKTPSS